MSRVWAFLACWIWLTNIYELLDVLHYISAAKAPVQMVPGSFRVRRVWNRQSRSASTDSLSWGAISFPDRFSPIHEINHSGGQITDSKEYIFNSDITSLYSADAD